MLDPAAWVASGSLVGCQPDCRVRAGEAESEQSGSRSGQVTAVPMPSAQSVPTPTALHPPLPLLRPKHSLHGSYSMEHGSMDSTIWTYGARQLSWGFRGRSVRVRCGAVVLFASPSSCFLLPASCLVLPASYAEA